jgi:SagB-type dehydrogenase family enzyme
MRVDLSRRKVLAIFGGIAAAAVGAGVGYSTMLKLTESEKAEQKAKAEFVKLPAPMKKSSRSLEETIESRRSRRAYTDDPIPLGDISQLCWAAQGLTGGDSGGRAAPSAGALYPLELYLVIGKSDLAAGVYHYRCVDHTLELVKSGDYRKELREASLAQDWVENGALDFVITAVYDRTMVKYGERGSQRYVPMEAGHVAENIYLQAESLALGTVSIGAFQDDRVREVISAPSEFIPLYVMPVGHVRR